MAVSGKLVGMSIVTITAVFAAGIYYAQVYGYYDAVPVEDGSVQLTSLVSGEPEDVIFEDFQAIDAISSPIRYRACFQTSMSTAMLTETYETFDDAVPLNAPGWFDCFDADEIGADLEIGTATAYLGERNIEYGIDRIVVIYPGGRGFAWNQLNDCGDKLYDGSPASEDCPGKGASAEDN